MIKRNSRIAATASLASALLVAGCAPRSDFPSLARRPAEDAYRAAQDARPAPTPPAVVSEGLPERLAALLANAGAAHATFESRQAAATRTINATAGAAKGTESWSVASVALAGLETARSLAAMPLADLDRLEADASNRAVNGSDADLKAVRAAREKVDGLVEAETRAIDSLRSRLGA